MIYPFLPDTRIDAEAVRLRAAALPPEGLQHPRVDLDAIVFGYLYERDELVIDLESDLPDEDGDEVLGKTTIRPGRIQVNSRLRADSGRFRFTLAHEVGHWILHRPLILAADEQHGLFGSTELESMPASLNRSLTDPYPPREEIQANRFAATLLIDHDILRKEFIELFGSSGAGNILRTSGRSSMGARDQARFLATYGPRPHLAETFGVSVEAMAIALESRKYLPGTGGLFEG